MLGAPELDAGLKVGSDESGVKGQNPLPHPAGLAALDAVQDGRGWKGPLRVTQSNPLLKQGHSEQAAQDHV